MGEFRMGIRRLVVLAVLFVCFAAPRLYANDGGIVYCGAEAERHDDSPYTTEYWRCGYERWFSLAERTRQTFDFYIVQNRELLERYGDHARASAVYGELKHYFPLFGNVLGRADVGIMRADTFRYLDRADYRLKYRAAFYVGW